MVRAICLTLIVAAASMTTAIARADVILLQDNFNDNSLDPTKWLVTKGSVSEVNQRIELFDRGILATQSQFDPASLGGVRISGQFRFLDGTFPDHDFLQILTRSDGVPGGGFNEVENGIEFHANANDTIEIVSHVNGVLTLLSAFVPLQIDDNDLFHFEAFDDGFNLSFSMTEVGGQGAFATVTASSPLIFAQNRIVFHNRENNNSSASLNYLDDVLIEQVPGAAATPEPSSAALLGFGLAGAGYIRHRRARRLKQLPR